MRRFVSIILAVALAIIVALSCWFALGWLQMKRADAALASANAHIIEANRLTADIRVEQLGPESFTSLERISQAAETARSLQPLVDQAATEVGAAGDEAAAAAGLHLLPGWYAGFLQKKQQAASLRARQLLLLKETAGRLQQLYAVGPVVFNATREMDRLYGQFQEEMGKVQSNPGEAGATLRQVAQSFTTVQQQLDQAFSQTGFDILTELSHMAADNAALSALGAQLAGAAGAGNQQEAQSLAAQLQAQSQTTSISDNAIDPWWRQRIKPLEQEYSELQEQEEALDVEAEALYLSRS